MIDIHELNIGDHITFIKKFNDEDLIRFSEISLDKNPIHLDKNFAKKTRYKKQIVYGMLPAVIFSGIFGTKLPGPGCVYKSQFLNFKRPIFLGDEVYINIIITHIDIKTKNIKFKTSCTVKNKTVIDGEATIFLPFR